MKQEENQNHTYLEKHAQDAKENYITKREFYKKLTEKIHLIIEECIKKRNEIKLHSITSRTKDIESFAQKASKPSNVDRDQPKYKDPLKDITDLSGVRVITYFIDEIKKVDQLLRDEFEIIETYDKGRYLREKNYLDIRAFITLLKLNKTELNYLNTKTIKMTKPKYKFVPYYNILGLK